MIFIVDMICVVSRFLRFVVFGILNSFANMIVNFQVRILDAAHCPTYKPKVIREKTGKELKIY